MSNLASVSGTPALPADAARYGADPATRTSKDFEAFFVTSMLESMTAGIKPDKMFGGGQGETLYRSMLNQEYGKAIAANGSLGISDAIRAEILKSQEGAAK